MDELGLNEAQKDFLVALKGFLQKRIEDGLTHLTHQFVLKLLIPIFPFGCQLSVMCNLGPFNQHGTGTAISYPLEKSQAVLERELFPPK